MVDLSCRPASEVHKVFDRVFVLRYAQVNVLCASVNGYGHRFSGHLHLNVSVHLIHSIHGILDLLNLILCHTAAQVNHAIVDLNLLILDGSNTHDGIPDTESDYHQGHTAADSGDCHEKPLLITEEIPDCGFPCKVQMFPDQGDSFQKNPLSFFW